MADFVEWAGSIWNKIWVTEADQWAVGEIPHKGTPASGGEAPRKIAADKEYISVTLQSAWIVNKRVGFSTFFGVVQSFMSVPSYDKLTSEYNVVVSPDQLKNLDKGNIDRVVQMEQPLLGPTPFRGGRLSLQIGLLAVKSADLLAPYLTLLQDLTGTVYGAQLAPALKIVQTIKNGVSSITDGNNNSKLMIGLSRQINNPKTGWYAVVGGPKSKIDINSLKVDPNDFKLLTSSGDAFTAFPYLVFSIDSHKTFDTWYDLPEMMDAWDAIKKAVRDNDRKESAASLESFRRILYTNPHILEAHADEIFAFVSDWYKKALPAAQTAAAMGVSKRRASKSPNLKDIKLNPIK